MTFVLDTHVLIWFITDSTRLPRKVLRVLHDPVNRILLSHVCVLEMQIKVQTGKLPFPLPLDQIVEAQIRINGFEELPISLKHIHGLRASPLFHRDPFDRLLISQAICEQVQLVTADRVMPQYPVSIFWN